MTTQLFSFPVFRALDSNGAPLNGGKLYTYGAGGTTPLATYTDSTGGTPNANPVVLDSTGSANVWLTTAAYKLSLTDSLGNSQWTVDNIIPGVIIKYGVTNITSAVNITLTNPLSTANVIDMTATGKNAYLPASNTATSIPLGVPVTFFASGDAMTVKAQDTTTTIVTIPASTSAIITLIDNSTANGTWIVSVVPGTGTYMELDGNGAYAINVATSMGANNTNQLTWRFNPTSPAVSSYTMTDTDRCAIIGSASAGGTLTVTLPDPAVVGDGYPVIFHRAANSLVVNSHGGSNVIALPKQSGSLISTITLPAAFDFLGLCTHGGNWQTFTGSSDLI